MQDERISEFERLMNCGHGRCFDMLAGNEELYGSTVLYGCLNDISFDMQCEGSRGLYMYNLAAQYDEPEYFLKAAAEKLLTSEINDDRHTINHLCDFIAAYAYDGNAFAADTLEKKYRELYSLLMTTRKSQKHMGYIECFEYISIVLMQFRHISVHTGMLNGLTIEKTGRFPVYVGADCYDKLKKGLFDD